MITFPSCLTHLATPVAQGGHTSLLKLRPTQIRECLLRTTVYFKVGCLEKSEVRVLCSWCVCKHFSRRYGVQKLFDRSYRVGMTQKFTGSWNDASCTSRN